MHACTQGGSPPSVARDSRDRDTRDKSDKSTKPVQGSDDEYEEVRKDNYKQVDPEVGSSRGSEWGAQLLWILVVNGCLGQDGLPRLLVEACRWGANGC